MWMPSSGISRGPGHPLSSAQASIWMPAYNVKKRPASKYSESEADVCQSAVQKSADYSVHYNVTVIAPALCQVVCCMPNGLPCIPCCTPWAIKKLGSFFDNSSLKS